MIRKNQKGFTLVELIIAVAILAIVTLAVCGFILVGSKSYTSANTDIMLQQEAQLALNQISDVIIDTTHSISYNVGTSTTLQPVLKDSEYSGEATDKSLVVVNKTDTTSNNDNKSYWFYWSKDTETIYFNEVDGIDINTPEDEIEGKFANVEDDKAVLAEHVTELSIDLTQFEENRVVMISMTLENGNRTYSTSNNVTVRNRITLNEVSIEPMKRQNILKVNASSVTMEPGEELNLAESGKVKLNASADELNWEITGSHSAGTQFTSSGVLKVDLAEVNPNIFVKVTPKDEKMTGSEQELQVDVKRVASVGGESYNAAPGGEVTLNGAATGSHLGEDCDKCHDPISEDTRIINWRYIQNGELIESFTETNGGATVRISGKAKSGDVIIIEADSYRSDKLHYGPKDNPTVPPVTGRWTIRIAGDPSSAIPLGSELKYGSDNDPGIFDFIREGLPTVNGEYVFCVRIREAGTSGCDNDYYMVYFSNGANLRFSPDAFGLDLTKNYDVYMQVLYPVASKYLEDVKLGIGHERDDKDTIWKEYSEHLDSEGKYVGNEYWASDFYVAALNPPVVSVKVGGIDNVVFPVDNEKVVKTVSLADKSGDNNKVLGMFDVVSSTTINMEFNAANGNNRMVIYKEDDNDSSLWRRVYGYGYDMEQTVSAADRSQRVERIDLSGKSNVNVGDNGAISGEKDYYLEKEKNQIGPLKFAPWGDEAVSLFMQNPKNGTSEDACGKYHIMVGFVYANKPNERGGYYKNPQYLIAQNINGDFKPYFYRQWDCVINLDLTMDLNLNLQLPGQNGEERWTNFPTPSEMDFPFVRKDSDIQTATWPPLTKSWEQIKMYSPSGEYKGTWRESVQVDCQYDSAKGEYTIWLYEEKWRNNNTYGGTVFGKYSWKPGDSKWTALDLVQHDNYEVTIPVNIYYTKDNHNWAAYVPLPSKSGFPFAGVESSGTLIKEGYSLTVYDRKYNYEKNTDVVTAECSYENGYYYLTFKNVVWNGSGHKKTTTTYGKWRCALNGTGWDEVSYKAFDEEAVWGSIIISRFSSNGLQSWDLKDLVKAEFPLPGQTGFPTFSDDTYTETKTLTYFDVNDTYGDASGSYANNHGTVSVTVVYTRNSDNTYTIELKNSSYGISYGKWQSDGDGWRQIAEYGKAWDTLVYFKDVNGTEYKMELPLPSANNFWGEGTHNITAYLTNDSGTGTAYFQYGGATVTITKANGVYRARLVNSWSYPAAAETTWTCSENGSKWVLSN